MKQPDPEIVRALTLEQYPRAAAYDPVWVLENQMGQNVLWQTEALCQVMDLQPGMRVLDMGCGRAVSSIFLAKEFGVEVWAVDLWIRANENWQRARAAGVADKVFPIQAEAHNLPFADGFFDAALSMDAYHYFGTDEMYLGHYYLRLLRPGGLLGIIVPGLTAELGEQLPEHLLVHWKWEYYSLHSPAWWRRHWEKTRLVKVTTADSISQGWELWLRWQEVRYKWGFPYDYNEMEMVRSDAGQNLGFTRLVATKC
jgi:cyclopropane fatty-acyl-phospholipid synthase-like methyltransferase